MRPRRQKPQREPTIALINVVFLMLVFFLVAGTVARPLDGEVSLVRTAELEGAPPPDALVIHADGRLGWRGEDVASAEAWLEGLSEDQRAVARLVPDRELPASELVAIGRRLREAGAQEIRIVTQRGLE
ncbi:ExbD/TolR family protein [Salipiger mucosus]|uniref:Biopolymer transport protein ExbD/TolR n=1 Tax=Salipiger mucosus DSM 16094 TaxID=1123237 RepID=S9Q2D9_9RHOB|nr:biopolymer transporter ExbD [Salipiger mucosus]EPX75451.1 Biopolymer transport protein ExbD/TolR [Salipiger mucosus DSM 16094]